MRCSGPAGAILPGMDDASIFGAVAGLPLHPLVVHGVVVLLPLMSLVTVLAASVAVALLQRAPGRLRRFGLVLCVLAGAVAIWWTVRTGHSGAVAVG